MKTILILEIGKKISMPYELGTENENGQFQLIQSGVLPGEGALEELKGLKARSNETWICESLVTKQNLRREI